MKWKNCVCLQQVIFDPHLFLLPKNQEKMIDQDNSTLWFKKSFYKKITIEVNYALYIEDKKY